MGRHYPDRLLEITEDDPLFNQPAELVVVRHQDGVGTLEMTILFYAEGQSIKLTPAQERDLKRVLRG